MRILRGYLGRSITLFFFGRADEGRGKLHKMGIWAAASRAKKKTNGGGEKKKERYLQSMNVGKEFISRAGKKLQDITQQVRAVREGKKVGKVN